MPKFAYCAFASKYLKEKVLDNGLLIYRDEISAANFPKANEAGYKQRASRAWVRVNSEGHIKDLETPGCIGEYRIFQCTRRGGGEYCVTPAQKDFHLEGIWVCTLAWIRFCLAFNGHFSLLRANVSENETKISKSRLS